jgi:hypothetical protein
MVRTRPVSRRRPALRASDADRESVVEQLREECAAGRLTADELSDRVEKAYARAHARRARCPRGRSACPYDTVPTRSEQLDRAIAEGHRRGWVLESRWETGAVMAGRRPPNHVVHAVLTFVAFFWGFVWLALHLQSRQRIVIEVDDDGAVRIERVR